MGEGFVVAQVTERQKASAEEFTKKKDELREQARRAKQIELEESFLKALRKQGTVENNPRPSRASPERVALSLFPKPWTLSFADPRASAKDRPRADYALPDSSPICSG